MTHKLQGVKVYNLESPRTSKPVANQFVIKTVDGRYFQSYDSVIAFIPMDGMFTGQKITLDADKWDYSVTTGKYRNMFLGENKAETEKKIKSGEYVLANLN